MYLHNFICDNALRDKEFEKCDEDDDYMSEDENGIGG